MYKYIVNIFKYIINQLYSIKTSIFGEYSKLEQCHVEAGSLFEEETDELNQLATHHID